MRRLLAGLLCCALLMGAAPVSAFDRVKEGERYRQWYAQLQKDIESLLAHVPSGAPLTNEDIERWCANSLVPGSRAIHNLRDWLSGGAGISRAGGGIAIVGPTTILISLLESSIPAGQGGLFPEKEGSGFPDRAIAYADVVDRSEKWFTFNGL